MPPTLYSVTTTPNSL